MKYFIFFSICLITYIHAFSNEEIEKFRDEVLKEHNLCRNISCAKPVQRNSTLDKEAQSYCQTMVDKDIFAHSNRTDFGENSYSHTPFDFTKNSGATPVQYWCAEKSNYTVSKPEAALHYTQVVWKATTMIGVGFCSTKNDGIITVVNYFPRGNYANQFADNVGC